LEKETLGLKEKKKQQVREKEGKTENERKRQTTKNDQERGS
jgi:hypothetical protein